MTNQELIKEINNNNFNEFELRNSLTDEVVKGNIIKLYGSTKGGMRIADELTLEYDRIYGIYIKNCIIILQILDLLKMKITYMNMYLHLLTTMMKML